jgi:formate dehydrogenase subunit gamma
LILPGCWPMIGPEEEECVARTADWSEAEAVAIVERHRHREGPLLPILHEVQQTFGHVPREAVPAIALALNLSRAEVWGVLTFYHDFRQAPAGRHVLRLCRAEACQSMGCEALVARAEARLGTACGTTRPDGAVTFEAVYCLGLCATGPSGMLDGRLLGRLDAARLDAVLDEALA